MLAGIPEYPLLITDSEPRIFCTPSAGSSVGEIGVHPVPHHAPRTHDSYVQSMSHQNLFEMLPTGQSSGRMGERQ